MEVEEERGCVVCEGVDEEWVEELKRVKLEVRFEMKLEELLDLSTYPRVGDLKD